MTRPIKFRAWDKKNKKWLLGCDVGSLGGFDMFGECMMFGEWAQVLSSGLSGKNGYNLNDLVVMQFTGLLDKNGKEIYEGDICRDDYGKNVFVEWCQRYARFEWHEPTDKNGGRIWEYETSAVLEVLGNIYENPELLK